MTGKLDSVNITADRPFIAYSRAWGVIGQWGTAQSMKEAMGKGLTVGFGTKVKACRGYHYRTGEWVPVCDYRLREVPTLEEQNGNE